MASKYLEEFEKLNTTTESIYDLGDLEVLIILNDGTNLTSWDDVEWEIGVDEFLHEYKYNENILYVSEDLSKYTDLISKYERLKSLKAIVALNVSDKVTNVDFMFKECEKLVEISSLKSWDVSNVEYMRRMFAGCTSLVDLFALKDWDVSNVKSMLSMFVGCSSLVDLSPLSNWDVSGVDNMEGMFAGCFSLVDLSALKDWNVSNVEFMREMFGDCSSLVDASCLNKWDLSNMRDIYGMFNNNNSLKQKPKFAEPMKIMFVCTANTCRSVMAEAIFKQLCKNVEVYSSGIFTENGKKPSKNTIDVCKSHCMDVSDHSAIYFKDSNIEEMDLVLTLEMLHKHKIKIYYPDLDVYTIREFIDEYPTDINDPFGGSYEVYMECFKEIYHALEKVKSIICTDNEDKIVSFKN